MATPKGFIEVTGAQNGNKLRINLATLISYQAGSYEGRPCTNIHPAAWSHAASFSVTETPEQIDVLIETAQEAANG